MLRAIASFPQNIIPAPDATWPLSPGEAAPNEKERQMQKLATHLPVVQGLSLSLLTPSLLSDTLAMSMLTFAAGSSRIETNQSLPYLVISNHFSALCQDYDFKEEVNCIAPHQFSGELGKLEILVFEDNSVIIQRHDQDSGHYTVVPWVFHFPRSFDDGTISFQILNPRSYPQFNHLFDAPDHEGRKPHSTASLLRAEKSDHAGIRPMREAFLAALEPEIECIFLAFQDALPLARGTRWARSALSGSHAAAPFLPHGFRKSKEFTSFVNRLSAWIHTQSKVPASPRILLHGRSVSPDGELGPVQCSIITTQLGRMHELESKIEALFDGENTPIPLADQVSQNGKDRGLMIISHHSDDRQPTSHEMIQITSELGHLFAD